MVIEVIRDPEANEAEPVLVERPAAVGDLVFGDGIHGTGTLCEYVCVMSSQVVIKPKEVSMSHAAGVPLAGLTAYQCFTRHARVQPGAKVLVLGGSGGVGSFAVQICKALGCYVAATSSDEQFLHALGCDETINYLQEDWGEKLRGQDYDVVFATVNDRFAPGSDEVSPVKTSASERAAGVLKKGGTFACTLKRVMPTECPPDRDEIELDGCHYRYFLTESTRAHDLAQMAILMIQGKLRTFLQQDEVFPFTEEAWYQMMEMSNSGRTKGKLVMKIAGD